jgi:hypothetical protein
MRHRLVLASIAAIAVLGCGTDPSNVDLTGGWHIVAHVHAIDLTEDQQSCMLDMGLTIGSDSLSTVNTGVLGMHAVGDDTGTFQCILYGETGTPTPKFQGFDFVVTRSAGRIKIYQFVSGQLVFDGAIKSEGRIDGVVGAEVLGTGTWVGTRR